MEGADQEFFEKSAIRLDWMGHQLAKYRNRLLECYGITQGQSKILHHLLLEEGNVVTQRDIERCFSISPSTVTSMLNTLEREELIRREIDSHDARVRRIAITDKGRGYGAIIHETAQKTEERFLCVLSPQERETFRALLKRLADNVREMEREKAAAPCENKKKEEFR